MPDSSSKVETMETNSCIFPELYKILEKRKETGHFGESYTAKLMKEGLDSILKKIGEETTEVVIAAKNLDHQEQINEISDLCYHVLVLMVYHGIELDEIHFELKKRLGTSGIEEKQSRSLR